MDLLCCFENKEDLNEDFEKHMQEALDYASKDVAAAGVQLVRVKESREYIMIHIQGALGEGLHSIIKAL
jgi:hypothetical protein